MMQASATVLLCSGHQESVAGSLNRLHADDTGVCSCKRPAAQLLTFMLQKPGSVAEVKFGTRKV